jgi:ATP-binding cassette subfamily B protein RaxB
MISGHHGHRIDLSALRRHYNISLKGMTLHDVARVASQLQLSTRALRVEMSLHDGYHRGCASTNAVPA